ncbi:ribosomal RNA processing protein 1 homolog A isoform X2 [Puntigrus tetrazona]|uniref:ribosomal RNA processing protein 1 homolog A isoform X2 n=1 Tax=Puntigrus tetrazona TaxID=1606681 RepID=UPI001C89E90C|nr:ribosomal RNA processing protein 1 homolog A isoform X2 [Puntigrus tetrazona]
MAATQAAEIVFAQKLASNEKPMRSKALVKLRKYISARSERDEGFKEEELLKIWKGLFYCLWMQDKPLLQEELSTKISRLLQSFQTPDSQMLYFKTFLQTMKREWNGIDRLRLDKFYQLIRFVFREVFAMLKRQKWETSLVTEFLQIFSSQLLQSSSACPAGLILHILDLYTTELAVVGSAELTAEQNQTFIEPFFKTMAKTKDRVLLKAIGSNVFNTIVDQVPFAIADLQREMRQSAEVDSGDESDHEQDLEDDTKTQSLSENSQETQDDEEDCDEDECLLSGGMDDEDNTCGPVLQFDYGAIADCLFEVASHSNIQSFNRSKIYKFVKIFRDLSEGVFPQDEVEKVSADEDEDEDNNGKRKRKRRKQKNKKKDEEPLKKCKSPSESEAASDNTDTSKDSKPKKKKRKTKNRGLESVEGQRTEESSGQDTLEDAEVQKTEEKLESDLENQHTASERSSSEPALNLLKKRRRKRKASRKTCEDSSEAADDGSEMEISITSAEIVTPVQLKKRKNLKRKAKGAGSEVTSVSLDASTAAKTSQKTLRNATSDERTESQDTSDSTTSVKKSKQTDAPESQEAALLEETVLSEAPQQTAGRLRAKKSKKSAVAQTRPERKRRVKEEEKPSPINGHADQTKTAKISKEPKDKTVRGFVLRQKKAPAPIFCKAAGHSTRLSTKRGLPASKSEMKKVTFGLKNNKTMEFRKMDRSSLLSPARQARVAFDPKRTPKSGVLKSPTSSPAVSKRAKAADFF